MELVIKSSRSLAEVCPDLLKDWDYDNNNVDPRIVPADSAKVVSWVCHENPEHRWMASISKRAGGAPCPGCTKGADRVMPTRKPKKGNSLAEKYPEIAAEWHQEYNGVVTANDVSSGTSSKYWFTCSSHGIVWEAAVCDRKNGKGCALCRGEKIGKKRSTLKPGDSLAEKYPDLTMEWDIQRNTTTPDKVFAHGRDLVHWVCLKCRRRWVSPVYNRTCNGAGCNKCSTEIAAAKERIPLEGHSLLEKFPNIANEFVCDEHGRTDPAQVAYSSGALATWKCSMCKKTTWKATVNARTAKKVDEPGCKDCSQKRAAIRNRKPRNGILLIDGAPDIADEWCTEKNLQELGLVKEKMALHSNLEAYWKCPNCNEIYLMAINKRTTRGDGCTNCDYSAKSSFPEKAVLYYVSKAFPDALGNASPEIDGLGRKEFDVWVPSLSTAIEYDGQGWHVDPDRDSEKERICFEAGVRLIRVREPKCATYAHMLGVTIVDRNPDAGFNSLDKAIRSVLNELGYDGDISVNCLFDEAKIRKEMGLEFIVGSLGEKYKEIADCWDYDSNNGLTPWMFKPYSDKEVYWLCKNGHDHYLQNIKFRVKAAYNGCPECNKERLKKRMSKPKCGLSLAETNPELIDEWHEDNLPLTPWDVGHGSGKIVLWKCPNHDEPYDMSVADRSRGSGCPFCSTPAKRVLPGFNDLATKFPHLKDEWDEEANGDITPYGVLPGSHYEAHWICPDPECGNRYAMGVHLRTKGSGCPKCKGKKISIAKMRPSEGESLEERFKEIADCWLEEANGSITPSMVRATSDKAFSWKCACCGDEFTEKVSILTKFGRAYCEPCRKKIGRKSRGVPRKPAPGRSVVEAEPMLDEFLIPEKNGGVSASDIGKTSKLELTWTCPKCGDEWETTADLMVKRKRKCRNCGYGTK